MQFHLVHTPTAKWRAREKKNKTIQRLAANKDCAEWTVNDGGGWVERDERINCATSGVRIFLLLIFHFRNEKKENSEQKKKERERGKPTVERNCQHIATMLTRSYDRDRTIHISCWIDSLAPAAGFCFHFLLFAVVSFRLSLFIGALCMCAVGILICWFLLFNFVQLFPIDWVIHIRALEPQCTDSNLLSNFGRTQISNMFMALIGQIHTTTLRQPSYA